MNAWLEMMSRTNSITTRHTFTTSKVFHSATGSDSIRLVDSSRVRFILRGAASACAVSISAKQQSTPNAWICELSEISRNMAVTKRVELAASERLRFDSCFLVEGSSSMAEGSRIDTPWLSRSR